MCSTVYDILRCGRASGGGRNSEGQSSGTGWVRAKPQTTVNMDRAGASRTAGVIRCMIGVGVAAVRAPHSRAWRY